MWSWTQHDCLQKDGGDDDDDLNDDDVMKYGGHHHSDPRHLIFNYLNSIIYYFHLIFRGRS